MENGVCGNLPTRAPRVIHTENPAFQGTCRVAANRSTQRTWSAVSGTCKPRATVSRLKASSGANPSAVSNGAKSKDERPIEALQWTATLRPALASALKSSTNRENVPWTAAFLDPGSGRIGRRSLRLHIAPLLVKDLAQQLRRPEAWEPTHPPPLVSSDPVRPPASHPREDTGRFSPGLCSRQARFSSVPATPSRRVPHLSVARQMRQRVPRTSDPASQ
jgi:hypothetical protein